ncbi:meiosis-specific transcription factor ndt80 [Ceratocystis pirilliformis]|uniref:Meiosis-specific transcription factor ndt80 n=1 Tax=Ceratocystis pirilliformis TaxID=259994 RepID=A0ABR3YI26_9PEZI
METSQYNTGKNQPQYPPLGPFIANGALQYSDNPSTVIEVDISGSIDKGFFLSPEGEWTCYRRNYFSCVCSYGLSPYSVNSSIQFTESNTSQPLQVIGFAMCISAVVAENDGHVIELVQHTPKRDKGPVMKPVKVALSPRPTSNHHPLGIYPSHEPRGYNEGFNNPQASAGGFQTEHTFERIQFKQATANNGKRRAAQQYYHLMIELWANVGTQSNEKYVKVGHRKSAKMIVRGRSPGHYQSERRGSTSSGPGSGTGGVTGYHNGNMMDTGFGPMINTYGTGFDGRGTMPYSSTRHHQPHHQHTIPVEAMVSAEDSKAIENSRGYQYYPSTVYESPHESKHGVEMFSHQQRNDNDNTMGSGMVGPYDPVGPRSEPSGLSNMYNPGAMVANRRYNQFESKPKSDGCYPTMMSQSGMNMS